MKDRPEHSIATRPSFERVVERRRFSRAAVGLLGFARKKPLGLLGAMIIVSLIAIAIFAPVISPFDYRSGELANALQGPSRTHWAGTDWVGRDTFSRVLFGARATVMVGFGSVAVGITIGTLIATLVGYYGGKLDIVSQRVVDIWQAFPFVIFVITVISIVGAGTLQLIFTLGLIQIATSTRVIRSAVIGIRSNDYIQAAHATGAGGRRIIIFHVLPNVLPTIIVLVTVQIGAAILAESTVSFLGYGIPPPTPTWGQMLSVQGLTYFTQAPWLAIWPGVAISLTVFAFNMFGDALRDVFDPRMRGS